MSEEMTTVSRARLKELQQAEFALGTIARTTGMRMVKWEADEWVLTTGAAGPQGGTMSVYVQKQWQRLGGQ